MSPKPKTVNGMYVIYLTEVEMKVFQANQDKMNQPGGDDSISVSLEASA